MKSGKKYNLELYTGYLLKENLRQVVSLWCVYVCVCGPAAAAPIGCLAWELPYAAAVTLKRKKKSPNVFPGPQCVTRNHW